jgi:futalosine hydrolase
MKILLVSATTSEIAPTLHHLEDHWKKNSFAEFEYMGNRVYPLVTGIGSMMMAFALSRFKHVHQMNLVIHAGISGSYKEELKPTELVEVISEQWGDLGAEDSNGEFIDAFELGLMEKDRFPYEHGTLFKKRHATSTGLKQVSGLTVNKSSGTQQSINRIKNKFNADVEGMEGAGLFYACNVMDLPFVSIRAISNYVEPRNKSNWKMEESLHNLNEAIIVLLNKIR